MADQYPSASVIGNDLSPIQPGFVPPNCTFEIDDVTLEWTYQDDFFDYIHIREMFGSIPDWDFFFQECYRCLKPGGWVEIHEHSVEPICDDNTQPADHFYWQWGAKVVECGEANGKSFTIWKEAKERLERAGFVDVQESTYKWPINGWPRDHKQRDIGRWNQLRLHNGIEGFMLRLLTSVGGVSTAHSHRRMLLT
jgi:SAM-dependent methyltransferase